MNSFAGFSCLLDGQPDHLTPEHQLQRFWSEDHGGHPLFLNPSCQFSSPNDIANAPWLTDGFGSTENVVWVRDSLTGALQPFWLGEALQKTIANIQSGQPVAPSAQYCSRSLTMAGVLVTENHATAYRQELSQRFVHYAEQVREKGYAPVAGLIHPFHISALRRYYRGKIRTGQLTLGDQQSSRRYYAHNESVARFFHYQLTSAVSAIVGQPVKPSYVYFASYQEGAILEKHTDRPQCQFSITFCLDYSPEPKTQTPWPLQLHTPNRTTTVYQSIGDALVYLGCEVPHSRGVLPAGHTSTSIFFHYVPVDFAGPLD